MRVDLNHIRGIAEMLEFLCDGDEQCYADMLVGESDIDRVVSRIHEQLARDTEILVGIGERKAALAERQDRIKRRVEAGKAIIGKVLRAGHLTKLELPEVTYSVRPGKAGLKIVAEEAVPRKFQREVKREPDKTKINEAYDGQEALPNWLVRELPRDVVTARTK